MGPTGAGRDAGGPSYTMKKWARRSAYLLVLLLWLVVISLPFFAFSLAARKQFEFGDPAATYLRIFVIQEKDTEGLGLEYSRPFAPSPGCQQTDVRYFMWSGRGENVTFCQCVDAEGRPLSAVPGACGPSAPD